MHPEIWRRMRWANQFCELFTRTVTVTLRRTLETIRRLPRLSSIHCQFSLCTKLAIFTSETFLHDDEKFPTAKVTPRVVRLENLWLGNPTLPLCHSVRCELENLWSDFIVPIGCMNLDDETRKKGQGNGWGFQKPRTFRTWMAPKQSNIFAAENFWLRMSLMPRLPTSCIYEILQLFEEQYSLIENNGAVNHFICTLWTINHWQRPHCEGKYIYF